MAVFVQTGGLDFAPQDSKDLNQLIANLKKRNLQHEVLTAQQVCAGFHPPNTHPSTSTDRLNIIVTIHPYIHTYIHPYIHIHIHPSTHLHTHIHIYTQRYIYIYTS